MTLQERYDECKEFNDGRTQGESKWHLIAWGGEMDNGRQDSRFIEHAPKTFELLTEYRDLLVEARRILAYRSIIGAEGEQTLAKLTAAIGEK